MIRRVIVDTGPLVALVDQGDEQHAWVQSQFAEIVPPLVTCEAVLTEACFLARRARNGVAGILGLIERGVVELGLNLNEHFRQVADLMRKYANVPMSLADACLVRMSELVSDCALLTLDSDFRIYRRHKRQKIPLLIPPER